MGSVAGGLTVQMIDPHQLKRFIPAALVAVALYVLFKPRFGEHDHPPRMSPERFDWIFGMGIGFYDGFLGPGTGTFFAMAFSLCLGFNLVKATVRTKVMNFASNIGSLILFICLGRVLFLPGVVMGVGQWLGARLGSGLVLTRGAKFVRPVFITAVVALCARLLYDVW